MVTSVLLVSFFSCPRVISLTCSHCISRVPFSCCYCISRVPFSFCMHTHGGDRLRIFGSSDSPGVSSLSFEWLGLRLRPWNLIWNFGDSWENLLECCGDCSESLFKILAVVIIWSPISSTRGTDVSLVSFHSLACLSTCTHLFPHVHVSFAGPLSQLHVSFQMYLSLCNCANSFLHSHVSFAGLSWHSHISFAGLISHIRIPSHMHTSLWLVSFRMPSHLNDACGITRVWHHTRQGRFLCSYLRLFWHTLNSHHSESDVHDSTGLLCRSLHVNTSVLTH